MRLVDSRVHFISHQTLRTSPRHRPMKGHIFPFLSLELRNWDMPDMFHNIWRHNESIRTHLCGKDGYAESSDIFSLIPLPDYRLKISRSEAVAFPAPFTVIVLFICIILLILVCFDLDLAIKNQLWREQSYQARF